MRLSRTVTEANRDELANAVRAVPFGAHFELVDDPRTLAQNRLMWKLLTDLSKQIQLGGEYHDAEAWKCAFLKSMGKKLTFMPSLEGDGVVAVGYRSSHLSKEEMSEMIERIYEYAARRGAQL